MFRAGAVSQGTAKDPRRCVEGPALTGSDVDMETYMKIAYAAFAFLLAAAAAACNTIEGAGRDIQSGGEAIEDAAQDAAN